MPIFKIFLYFFLGYNFIISFLPSISCLKHFHIPILAHFEIFKASTKKQKEKKLL